MCLSDFQRSNLEKRFIDRGDESFVCVRMVNKQYRVQNLFIAKGVVYKENYLGKELF